MTIYLSENIKRLRRENELTQETLAEFLGVTFQSVSNWERGESFPDITMLPDIAAFFKVSVDELLGINRAENEQEITDKLKRYDNLTDHKLMQEIITELKDKYPNDFRVLIRYLGCLVRYSENLTVVSSEVFAIYNNISQNCTDDRIRIKSKRALIEYYRALLGTDSKGIAFEQCEKIICEMPDMRDCREMFCTFYPEAHPDSERKLQEAIEECFLIRTTFFSHCFYYNDRCSAEWQIELCKNELECFNIVYDDGNYGKMWRTVMNCYCHLGAGYFRIGDTENALKSFRQAAELAVRFDDMERITVMHSAVFDGKEFDKFTLGSTFVAKSRVKELLTKKYQLSDKFKSSGQFNQIISLLR